MRSIDSFFERVRKVLGNDTYTRSVVSEVLSESLGVSFDSRNISIHGAKVSLTTTPLIRGEIYMKKEKILTEINRRCGKPLLSEII